MTDAGEEKILESIINQGEKSFPQETITREEDPLREAMPETTKGMRENVADAKTLKTSSTAETAISIEDSLDPDLEVPPNPASIQIHKQAKTL